MEDGAAECVLRCVLSGSEKYINPCFSLASLSCETICFEKFIKMKTQV
jgi:hypothetical protein